MTGVLLGLISGMYWEKLALAPYGKFNTLAPSLILTLRGKEVHLVSFFVGAIVFDILKFPDWYKFVK